MRWVPDRTGRFPQRPYYPQEELNWICEARVRRFLQERRGRVACPLSTNDLIILVQQDTDDLDLYADLSDLGGEHADVEGVPAFYTKSPERRLLPSVAILYSVRHDGPAAVALAAIVNRCRRPRDTTLDIALFVC